jgi:hypothetical protein
MKHLVGKNPTSSLKFCGQDLKFKKLSVAQVLEIQEKSRANADSQDEAAGMDLLQYVITCAVEGASELTKEEFQSFPVDELSNLSNAILVFSGLGNESKSK